MRFSSSADGAQCLRSESHSSAYGGVFLVMLVKNGKLFQSLGLERIRNRGQFRPARDCSFHPSEPAFDFAASHSVSHSSGLRASAGGGRSASSRCACSNIPRDETSGPAPPPSRPRWIRRLGSRKAAGTMAVRQARERMSCALCAKTGTSGRKFAGAEIFEIQPRDHGPARVALPLEAEDARLEVDQAAGFEREPPEPARRVQQIDVQEAGERRRTLPRQPVAGLEQRADRRPCRCRWRRGGTGRGARPARRASTAPRRLAAGRTAGVRSLAA